MCDRPRLVMICARGALTSRTPEYIVKTSVSSYSTFFLYTIQPFVLSPTRPSWPFLSATAQRSSPPNSASLAQHSSLPVAWLLHPPNSSQLSSLPHRKLPREAAKSKVDALHLSPTNLNNSPSTRTSNLQIRAHNLSMATEPQPSSSF